MGFYWSFGITWNFRNYILIMTSWKTYKLGELVKVKGGKRLPKGISLQIAPNTHPYIRIRDMGKSRVLELDATYEYVDDVTQKSIARYVVDEGDILLSIVGTIGLVGIVGKSLHQANQTENCVKLVNLNGIDPLFLYYFLLSPKGQEEIKRGTVGAVQAKLPIKNIENIEISLPSLEEQRRIAGILGAIDDKIENNRRINTNLELQAQALFEKWLGKIPTTKGVFNDIIKTTIAGDWGQENKQGNYTHEVFCIRGADIPTLRNGDKGKMPIRYILEKNYNTKQLQANDIVVEISGGSPTQSTGRVCMVTQSLLERLGKDLVCTNFCRAITPKDNYAIFIFLYWQMLYNKNTMFSYENGTTGIKNFNVADFISKEGIEIPSSNDVEKLNAVLQPMYNQIYANGLQNETLATLRDTLLPKLMNGEIKTE